jgi:hypothetical protein
MNGDKRYSLSLLAVNYGRESFMRPGKNETKANTSVDTSLPLGKVYDKWSEAVFTTLYFLRNLQIGPIS